MNQKLVPVLIILLVAVSFFAGIFYIKSQQSSKVGSTPTLTPPLPPLAIENLKKDASDLGLDTQKFNQCLDNSEKANKVREDIALGNIVGVRGTPAFFINGRFLGGAFPFEFFKEIIDKELDGKGSDSPEDYSKDLQEAAKLKTGRPADFNPKPVKVEVKENDQIKGLPEAKVTIVEFSDYQCPFCVKAHPTVKQIIDTYGQDVRVVFKNYPLPNHSFAQKAAEAALCATDQGKFWEYHNKLFDSQQ